MQLYSLTLQPSGGIAQAIYGNFTGRARSHEFIVSRGKVLELLVPDDAGEIVSVCELQVFANVRSIQPLRLTGDTRDYIVVGSDAGRLSILEYSTDTAQFNRIHCETYGKSGARRIVPGQFVAVDPQGRAVMVAALEKQKLVYVTNRDSSARLTISSPLEAHKSNVIVFHICGLDVGFDNPIFAALEVNTSELDEDTEADGKALEAVEKELIFYELDLGLNHVIRKWSETVERTANHLVPVPGGGDGPSGVLVCSEDKVTYHNQDHAALSGRLPRRQGLAASRSVLIVSSAVHRQKNLFFVLLQSDLGDLYKVELEFENDKVSQLSVEYFDSCPVSAGMCITKRGLLFLAAEFGDHVLYQFSESRALGEKIKGFSGEETAKTFVPRALSQLKGIDTLRSMAPCLKIKVANLCNEESPQIYALCGRGERSSLRVLRNGLETANVAQTQLPGNPNAVWTVRGKSSDEYDKYIVVSFINATLVLSVGEKVEQVTDSGFDTGVQTLAVCLLANDSTVQVHKKGIRHLPAGGGPPADWDAGGKSVQRAAVTTRQVCVALSGGEVVYFELDEAGSLTEISRVKIGVEVTCVSMPAVPQGRVRSGLLSVGCYDKTVRMFSLDPASRLKELGVQGLPDQAESLCFAVLLNDQLTLCIGLANGILVRTIVDETSGQMKDTRTQFLGARPVRCHRLEIYGQPSVIALSSRPWLCYAYQNRIKVTPLSYDPLSYAANFANEQCDGIVAITRNTLRIFTVENLGQTFNVQSVGLAHTPRRVVVHPQRKNALVIIEGDHMAPNAAQRKQAVATANEARRAMYGSEEPLHVEDASANDEEEEEEDEEEKMQRLSFDQIGYDKLAPGQWTSLVRVVEPSSGKSLFTQEFGEGEMAVSMAVVVFKSRNEEPFLVIGTTTGMRFHPRSIKKASLSVFRFMPDGTLNLLHATEVPGIPLALCGLPDGRLIVGIGNCLRLYELGIKHLLLKYEYRGLSTMASFIHAQGDRIYVGDAHESLQIYKYFPAKNKIAFFADDITPRLITTAQVLDFDTIAGADKFGNIFILRVPAELSETVDIDVDNTLWEQSKRSGAPNKLQQLAQFYVGETVTSIEKAALVPGRTEVLVYSTVMGAVGVLAPFMSKEDADFFNHLEMHLRNSLTEMVGREHLSYRSAFIPVKGVIDGDLCEQYLTLPKNKQKAIAEELDASPSETIKKIEELYIRLI